MKIFLTNQTKRFSFHLKELMNVPVSTTNSGNLKEKTSIIQISEKTRFDDITTRFLFDYEIFPPTILTALPQWTMENRKIKTGDIILQQVFLPPLSFFSIKILFGVQITSVINEPDKVGFSYQTLSGHAETGTSTFLLEKTEEGVQFKIQTFSSPGNWLSRILGPVFSVPYQTYCTKQALLHVKRQLAQNARMNVV